MIPVVDECLFVLFFFCTDFKREFAEVTREVLHSAIYLAFNEPYNSSPPMT